ncbi:hypothetical protein CSA37_04415 [Candidatus Fermentibacteria bacterium]|nr:MAG: hypothetical protein CSA37_04415 [Candidatus Fermentibacteria bacterium]
MRYLYSFILMVSVCAAFDFSYTMSMSQQKETSSLTNSFSATETISPQIDITGNGTFSADRSEGIGRFTDSRSGTGTMSWRPVRGIEMSTSFNRLVTLEDRFKERVRENYTESATGSIRFATGNWLNTDLSVGVRDLSYTQTSGDTLRTGNNDGDFYRVSSTVNRSFFNAVNTSIGFSENRSYGKETENGNTGLNVRMSYYFPEQFRGGSLNAMVSAERNSIVYLDSLTSKVGETWSHSETAELPEIIPGVFIQFSTGWNRDNNHFESTVPDSSLENPRTNANEGRFLTSNLLWEASDDISLDFAFSRTADEKDNTTLDYVTGNYYILNEESDDKLLDIVLTYTPDAARITFQRIVELYSYDTSVENGDSLGYVNDYDRDEYRQLLSITASIPLSRRFTLLSSMSGQERSLYYLMATQSASSRTTSTYAFSPGYRYDLGDSWKMAQSVKITATYTDYIFQQAGLTDRLSRSLNESFSLVRTSTDSTTLGFTQEFRFSDQGTMADDRFLRSEETINAIFGVDMGFHVSGSVGVTPTYSYQYFNRDRIAIGLKSTDHIHHLGLRSAIDLLGGTLNTTITRSFYSDASKQSYWRANVAFNLRM